MSPHRVVSRAAARRFLVRRHLLAPPRALPPEPASVMRVMDRIGSLQFDPLEVAGRNHDLVLLARVAGYRRAWTEDLLYRDRVLFETYNKMFSLVPTAELPWYRLSWDRLRARHHDGPFDEHAELVEELLERIRVGGPLSSTDVEPRAAIDWYWRPTNQVRALLEALGEAGILGISRREGNRRVYDLVERLFPADLLAERPPEREQLLHKLLSRYRGNGLLGATGEYTLWMGVGAGAARASLRAELVDRGALVPVEVEGLRGLRFVVADELALLDEAVAEIDGAGTGLDQAVADLDGVQTGLDGTLTALDGTPTEPDGGLSGATKGLSGSTTPETPAASPMPGAGVAFLAPLDPLAWDRDLLARLFDFDYRWEVYVPAAKRRFGYYVLPLLYGDRIVGRIEPRIDRKAGTLRILGLWWEDGFDPMCETNPGFTDAFAEAVRAHAAFAGLRKVALPRTRRHRELAAAVRARL